MNRIIISSIISILLQGCVSPKEEGNVSPEDTITIVHTEDFTFDSIERYDSLTRTEYDINIPVTGNSKFNSIINDSLKGFEESFRRNIAEVEIDQQFENHLSVLPETLNRSGDLLNVVLIAQKYYAGAAHPSSEYISFTFDEKKNRLISQNDIFILADKTDSALLLNEINKALEEEELYLNELSEINFSITSDSVTYYFDSYEVGPYAAGTPKATIPLENLRSILRANFRK